MARIAKALVVLVAFAFTSALTLNHQHVETTTVAVCHTRYNRKKGAWIH
jgi:hypothetical protein